LLALRVCVESVEQMLSEFGPRIYSADGPTVPFFGFPYPTRMAVVQLSEGSLWVWSPVALTDELDDLPDPAWAADIDQAIFRGSFVMEEVVFFHRPSRTAIVGDLIQRHPESAASGLKGLVMRLDGLVGARGSAPREWRATFVQRRRTRAALETRSSAGTPSGC
jgi:hypothetical protein